jgi:hypothetical protein
MAKCHFGTKLDDICEGCFMNASWCGKLTYGCLPNSEDTVPFLLFNCRGTVLCMTKRYCGTKLCRMIHECFMVLLKCPQESVRVGLLARNDSCSSVRSYRESVLLVTGHLLLVYSHSFRNSEPNAAHTLIGYKSKKQVTYHSNMSPRKSSRSETAYHLYFR